MSSAESVSIQDNWSINILISVPFYCALETVIKVYDYMAVMSNVIMGQQSHPNASKISNAGSLHNGIGNHT